MALLIPGAQPLAARSKQAPVGSTPAGEVDAHAHGWPANG